MKRPVLLALSVVVAALLVGGVVAVGLHDRPVAPAPPAPTTTTSSAPPTTALAASPLAAVLPELQAFVERERGLEFERPVDVALLGDQAFSERVLAQDEHATRDVQDAEAVLHAMGLLEPGVDLLDTVRGFVEATALGVYDAEADELVVRGASVTPLLRKTLVHELTHALEDQHFDLDRQDLGDEASMAFASLVEGSALRIEDRYMESLSSAERRAVAREEAALGEDGPEEVPDVVEAAFGFPYEYGPLLVRALIRNGGQARLDAAFADPPVSTEHVLDPRRYLRGDKPRPVPVPRADRRPFDDGEVGQLFLILMLDAELTTERSLEAAIGWGGDRYVAWRDGPRTCVRMQFVMDTPSDTDQLVKALAEWASRRSGAATASGASLTTCG